MKPGDTVSIIPSVAGRRDAPVRGAADGGLSTAADATTKSSATAGT